jgi:GST-like protein
MEPVSQERRMIELFTWSTPNGHKVHIALEELGLPYKVTAINIGAGEQFAPAFLAINPNHRIPAITDDEGPGGAPITLFESGAILIYLAEKAVAKKAAAENVAKLIPADPAARYICLQWLMFQMGGIGPMFGQANHFLNYAPEKIPYAMSRYRNEVIRLIGVLEKRLSQVPYLAGADYSIADIATFPWIRSAVKGGSVALDQAPSVQRWMNLIDARPAVARGLTVLADRRDPGPLTDKAREVLFGATQYTQR